jgi:hypothetical protein
MQRGGSIAKSVSIAVLFVFSGVRMLAVQTMSDQDAKVHLNRIQRHHSSRRSLTFRCANDQHGLSVVRTFEVDWLQRRFRRQFACVLQHH